MKAGIHPSYRYVVFQDTSSGDKFITRSTIETAETVKWEDGNEYPLAKVEISAFTHPFYTGQMKIIDTAGRVERFERRYGNRKRKGGAAPADAPEEAADAPEEATAAPEEATAVPEEAIVAGEASDAPETDAGGEG